MSVPIEQMNREDAFAATIEQARAAEQPQETAKQPEQQTEQETHTEAEPFEGFNALPPQAQEAYRQMQARESTLAAERDRYRRESSALSGRVPGLQRELERLKKAQQSAAPSEAQQRKLERWEEFKQRFPEDAEGLEERFAALESRLVDPKLANRLEQVEARFRELDAREQREAITAAQEQLSAVHPDWQVIAGMVDQSGKAIPVEQQAFHPEFVAWHAALPQWKQDHYMHLLTETRDVEAHAAILSEFKADYEAALEAEENQGRLPAKRRAALDDVSPTGGGGSGLDANRDPNTGRFTSSREDDYAETVNRFRDQWQKR